ncbi:MAG: 4-hydroxy-3-methylbut-2-enyl diphosphate reductase [Breznakia sp.]
MEIIKVVPQGYCKGVVRAIRIAKETREKYPCEDIFILGMLVHNTYVINALAKMNIKTIEDKRLSREELLKKINHGVVIFTAHGVAKKIKNMANAKGLICVDASCPDVINTQQIVDKHRALGYEIFYVGKRGHPEAAAVCEYDNHIHLIETLWDVDHLQDYEKILVTNQTTMSIFDTQEVFEKIKRNYPHAKFSKEICNATKTRQNAIHELQDVDVLFIVGDSHSNNSKRLVQIGKERGVKHVYLIESVNDIQKKMISNAKYVAVSAGASTPTYLIKQVLNALKQGNFEKRCIDLSNII